MTWDVTISGPARRDLRRLDRQVAQRILAAIARFAETGQGDIRRLSGSDGEWRLRVGDWRVKMNLDEAARMVTVLHVLPRGRAYRR